jgi:hypothetical protein
MSDTAVVTAEEITRALGGKWHDGMGKAPCPGHNGTHNYLHIWDGDDGSIGLKCHSKDCAYSAIANGIEERTGLRLPLRRKQADQTEQPQAQNNWRPMVPPLESFDGAQEKIRQYRPDELFEYRSLTGYLTHFVLRKNKYTNAFGIEFPKKFTPLTYGLLNNELGWQYKEPATPLPLYGLERLADTKAELVILCEGEKSADAAQIHFGGEAACLAWMGGHKKAKDADLTPLANRFVVVWPDADDVGRRAGLILARALSGSIVCTNDLPNKHDAADMQFASVDAAWDWLKQRIYEPPTLSQSLSATAWLARKLPPRQLILGNLITTNTRMLIAGPTGSGKTQLALHWGFCIALGRQCMHWSVYGSHRVLYLDGEMPPDTIIERMHDAERRAFGSPGDNFLLFSRMYEREMRQEHPELDEMPPLNTPQGQAWFYRMLDMIEQDGGPAVVFLDNLMSLTAGVQKEEETFSAFLPLLDECTRRRIAVVIFDHTGYARDKLYGTSTKGWRLDTIGLIMPEDPADDTEPPKGLRPFKLSFEYPHGKARMRTEHNWKDYQEHIISLDEYWGSCEVTKDQDSFKVRPERLAFLGPLREVATERDYRGRPKATVQQWQEQCFKRGLLNRDDKGDRTAAFRKAKSELAKAGLILCDEEQVVLNV